MLPPTGLARTLATDTGMSAVALVTSRMPPPGRSRGRAARRPWCRGPGDDRDALLPPRAGLEYPCRSVVVTHSCDVSGARNRVSRLTATVCLVSRQSQGEPMSAKDALLARLQPGLVVGEQVLAVTVVQVKGGQKRELAKTSLAGAAAGIATLAVTGGALGLMVVATPPPAWFVATTHRVILIDRRRDNEGLAGAFFVAPRSALAVRLKSAVLNEITLLDPADGQSVARLNVGIKKRAAREIVAAIETGAVAV